MGVSPFGMARAGLAAAALLASAGTAQAASWEDLCAGDAAADAASGDLVRAAAAAEAALESGRAAGSYQAALAALEVPLDSSASASDAARAEYCAAAGEVMRVAPEGSQVQAQSYLMRAFVGARAAGAERLASRAAYRLGLVSLAGPAIGGARGGAQAKTRSAAAAGAQQAAEVQEGEGEACAALAQSDLAIDAGTYVSALALQCASERALRSEDPQLSALASLRLARLGIALAAAPGANREELRRLALEAAVGALPVADRIADPATRAELLGRLVSTAIELGGADPAMRAGIAAMRAAGDASAEAFALGLEARLALASGDAVGAAALARQALFAESQKPLPTRIPEWYLLLAEAEPEERERHVSAAYTALDNLRPLLPRLDPLTEESVFTLHMRKVFENAVEVQLAGAETGDEGARIRDAQAIVEAYRQAELQSAFGSECVPPREPVRPEELADNEILLYPILLPDRVELLYASGREAGYRRLPPNRAVDRARVAELVEQVVVSMSVGEDDAWRAPAAELYRILIAPVADRLEPGSMLAIVPDGALRALPFAALIAPDGRYLVEQTRLSIAPALAYSQPGGGGDGETPTVVAASLQRQLNLPAGFFSELQGTAAEARIAADGAAGRWIEDFRKADLVQALSETDVDVLHLATHASFNGRSDRAFIVANGEVILLSELRDILERNRARGEMLELLVLSACETAVGDDEATMGLAGAAVQAGALSAIASLWQVNDAGTAELMRNFYDRFRAGRSRSEALREAQLALIEAGGANADPNVWAAFALLGAWR